MRNLTLLTDLYQLTMMYGYFQQDCHEMQCVFDVFYRKKPEDSAYCIMAGLEQVIEYLENLNFSDDDIVYLRSLDLFDEKFLGELKHFCFHGELYAVPEGTVVFPQEPFIRVLAPIWEAQLIETALLNMINHQTLIATKASRIVYAAAGDTIMEFGTRRAQGPDAAIYGARAAIIGGASSTSNVLAGKLFDVPISGTHAHSWVLSFPSELEAFRAYAKTFPDSCLLLVDTYDTLNSGVPNAIQVFKELKAEGHQSLGIRLDSGDLAYLSKKARAMLDQAGLPDIKICASNDLDEVLIRDLKSQGARIDIWGVGTKLITGGTSPALGGVYKLAAELVGGSWIPKMKLSENSEKVTLPGYKKIFRLYDQTSHKALADVIALENESLNDKQPLRIYHPTEPWKSQVIEHFEVRELLVPVFQEGARVYEKPTLQEISVYARQELETLWDEYKRPYNPQEYKVDLSDDLYDLKVGLLKDLRENFN